MEDPGMRREKKVIIMHHAAPDIAVMMVMMRNDIHALSCHHFPVYGYYPCVCWILITSSYALLPLSPTPPYSPRNDFY